MINPSSIASSTFAKRPPQRSSTVWIFTDTEMLLDAGKEERTFKEFIGSEPYKAIANAYVGN